MEKNYAIAAKADLVEIMKTAHHMYKVSKEYGCLKDANYYHGVSEGLAKAIGNNTIYHTVEKSGYTVDKANAVMATANSLSVVFENRKEFDIACYHDGMYDAMRLYLAAKGVETVA